MKNLLTNKQLEDILTINSLQGNYVHPDYLKELVKKYKNLIHFIESKPYDPDLVEENYKELLK